MFPSLLVAFSCLYVASAQFGRFDCPEPWLSFEDSCYYFNLFPNYLKEAREACEIDGASLVSVSGRAEHEFISTWIKTFDKLNNAWYTSGRRSTQDTSRWYWEGTGTIIEGDQYWIDEEARAKDGDFLFYGWNGAILGWMVGMESSGEERHKHPYICEINKNEIYRILREDRGYEYGTMETDPLKFLEGPRFILQPRDVIYDTQGQEKYVVMECDAVANPNPQYRWYLTKEQQRREITTLQFDRYTVTNGRLKIHEPKDVEDNGDYQCVAENTFGAIVSDTVQLSFGYLLDFPKSRRDPVRVQAYYGTGIECNEPNNGYPYLLFSWYKDNIRNFIRPALKPYTFVSSNGKLYFSSVTKDDVGMYHCVVSSPYSQYTYSQGKVSTEIGLEVSDAVASVHEPQIASGFPTVFPPSPKRGDSVHLECFAMGTDELYYTWERVGAPMPPTATFTDHNRVLNIPDAKMSHRGEYKCTVKRENGLSTSGLVQLAIEAAPFFTIPLKNQHMDHEADLTWRCIAEGIPEVTYAWYKNAEELIVENLLSADQERYSINNNVLTITTVDPERDSGMYQCAAQNSHGTRFSSAQLRVLSFKPSFSKYPLLARQYGTMNGNTTILCQPEAAPTAEKEWLKDGRPLQASSESGSRILVLPNGNLRISRLKQADKGNYTCVASNLKGMASSWTNLTILSTTTLSQAPRDIVVEQGRTAFLRCEASYNPVLDITYDWYQNDYKIEFIRVKTLGQDQINIERDEHFKRGGGINRGGLFIVNTKFENAGEYTCIAKTTTDIIERSALLTVVGPPSQPAGVYGEAATNDSIILTWGEASYNGAPIMEYLIEVANRDKGEDAWEPHPIRMNSEILANRRVRITGLAPWSSYFFRVSAENKYGIGKPSQPSSAYTTLADKPSRAPEMVGGGGGKVGTLVMEWEPVPRAYRNGGGFGYVVKWKKRYMIDEEWDIETVYGAENNRYVHTVGSDNFYTEYTIQVQGFNDMGFGPSSEEIHIFSAEDIPIGVATNVRASQFNGTALYVEWIPVTDNIQNVKGVLKGYRINYWKEESEDEEMSIYRMIMGQTDGGLIIGLDYNTQYIVNVQVVNTAGNGPKSQDFLQKTLRAPPLYAPTEVAVDVDGYDSINVKWRGVSTTVEEEPLEGYMVRIWRVGENLYVADDYDAMKNSRLAITGLETDTLYNLRVYGYSRGGQGLMSSPGKQFIIASSCRDSVRQDFPDKEYIYKCRGQTDAASHHQAAPLLLLLALVYTKLAQIL